MSEETRSTKDYLGDSVYAEVTDAKTIRLTTENGYGPSNAIYIEIEVLAALIHYAQRHELIKKIL
jgi:hypothetical protein